jgi:phytoene desaturase
MGKSEKVLIVGSGLGGLTTALRLHRRGFRVELVEKFNQPGGRLNQVKKDGFTWDMGPTFFSMTYEFKEFFEDAQLKEMPFEFRELDRLYSVNFRASDKRYVIYKDLDRLAQEFEEVEPNFREKMNRFLDSAARFFMMWSMWCSKETTILFGSTCLP